ncbi:hypothetical protein T4C_9732 [Trichinella pseudospiralis]|uniref:SEFIR domain-containing protein n=1 Tax=Trichinella pseudospiralis TaxID=6337 RepID=A0A0V1K416_TRIPS|nr:hypothetical protein T4C_9732 [Trichinella pseudospiralis]
MRIIVAVVCIFWSVCICYSGREILSGCTSQDRLGCLTSSKCDFESEGEVDYPSISPPHDLRIVCHIMVNSEGELPVYQLVTNITWRPPFDETLERVRGFGLTIIDEDTGDVHCYTMRVDNSKWTKADQSASVSIVMWLFLDNLFAFGSRYRVDVETLPKSSSDRLLKAASTATATQLVTMPERPDSGNMLPPAGGRCSPQARLNAYRWVTAFRLVHIKSWHRSIDVQFIAAPPAFCFNAYELRLIQSKRDIVQSGLFQVDKLYKEQFDNATIYYGNYTFYNVQPGEYSIGIIPIDKDENGTCLCPAPGEHCSCSLSVLPDFVMQEVAFPTVDPCEMISSTATECNHKLNGTKQFVIPHVSFSDYFTTNVMLLSVCVAVGMICLLFGVLYIRQRWMKAFKGNLQRYISSNPETTISLLPLATGKAATVTTTTKQLVGEEDFRNNKALVKLGEQHLDSVSGRPVYCILLLYAPDSAAHEQCVRCLASWLQQACSNISLCVDFLCRAEVARSKTDWAQRSVQQADLIVLVQSTGAFMRYQAKVLDDPDIGIVQRKQPSEFDDLFLIQVDLLLNALLCGREFGANERRGRRHRHRRLINLRFSYTGNEWTLPPFASHTCYELPNHFQFFLHTLTDHGIQVLPGSIEPLRKAILDASEFINVNRDWFLSLHCRLLTTNRQTVDNDNNNTRWNSIGNNGDSSSCKHPVEEDDAALEQPHQNFAMHDDDDDELKKQFTHLQRKKVERKLEKDDQFKQIIRQLVVVEHAYCSDVGVAAGAGTTTLDRCLEQEKQNNPTVSVDDGFGDDSGEQRSSSSSSSSISHLQHLTSSRYSPPPPPAAVAVP